MPKYVEPLLASARDKPPSGELWVHEIKYDGYRVQLHKSDAGTKVYTRRGHDWSARFPTIVSGAWHLKADSAILDGEAVVLNNGQTDFSALESYVSSKGPARHQYNLVFVVFDLLHLDGADVRELALLDRKRALKALLEESGTPFIFSEHLDEDGKAVFHHACKLHWEGIVSKRKGGAYRSGRNELWAKTTCRRRETFLIAGIAYNNGKFDGLYLCRKEKRRIAYAGKVENGFSQEQMKHLEKLAGKLKTGTQPFTEKIKKPKAQWLKPEMRCDVEYRRKTAGGLLRHPSYKGLRED